MKKAWNAILTILALAFLVAYSYPAFVIDIESSIQQSLDVIQWVSWFAFALDLAFNLIKAKNKITYLKSHPLEILAVALPMFRPLRLLRFVSIGSVILKRVNMARSVGITLKVAVIAFFLTYIAAVQITISERIYENGNIKTFSDGYWWAVTTVTTVGYGDRFPVSTEGRFIAFGLMVVGISLIGVITASVAAWFVRMMQDDSEK
jgi:voltage-gated potassium channel